MKTPLELTKQFVEGEIIKAISEGKNFVSFYKNKLWYFSRGTINYIWYRSPTIKAETLRLLGFQTNYKILEGSPVDEKTISELKKLMVCKKYIFFGKKENNPIIEEFIKNIPNMPKWAQLQW